MSEKVVDTKLGIQSKQLAIHIYDFLLDERFKKHLTKEAKRNMDNAVDALENVYKITFANYVLPKDRHPLQEIFAIGYHPVPIKNRIAAEKHKQKGNSFMGEGKHKLAEVEYTKAMRLDPKNAIYYCNRAASRIRQSLFPDAMSDCTKALKLDQEYAKAYGWLGIAYAMMDHPARAVRCYRKAIQIEPENTVYVENMDLINRKINHASFRVLEPFYMCRRGIARIARSLASNQTIFRRKNREDDTDKIASESKSVDFQIEKFYYGSLD